METSSQEKILIEVVKILDNLRIKYFITGGFAVSVWGRPRATFDIDIVVKIIGSQAKQLTGAWREISKSGYADEEMIKDAIKNNSEFNFIDADSGVKVDFWVEKGDINSPPEFKNKRKQKVSGQDVFFISPEDLIISKLEWYKLSESDRHIDDVKSVLKVSGDKLNKKYLNHWISKFNLAGIIKDNGISL